MRTIFLLPYRELLETFFLPKIYDFIFAWPFLPRFVITHYLHQRKLSISITFMKVELLILKSYCYPFIL